MNTTTNETVKAMATFTTAARKVEKLIAAYRAGGDSNDAAKVRGAIEKLYDRANKPEIRGSEEANEEAARVCADLMSQLRDSHDVAYEARVTRRNSQIKALDDAAAERRAAAVKDDPAFAQYRRDLGLAV